MASHNIHPSVNIGYSYPQLGIKINTANASLPRDILLGRNLKVTDDPKPQDPIRVSEPISKIFKGSDAHNHEPLQSLLDENRASVANFELALPYGGESQKPVEQDKFKPAAKNTSDTKKKARGLKRNRQLDDDEIDTEDFNESSFVQAETSSVYNTPIPNKTIFFSPSGSSKKPTNNLLQSTPVAMLNHQRSQKKLLKTDKSTLVLNKLTVATKEPKKQDAAFDEAEDSDYDRLACHADNIMRMAVDSTMLGSSFSLSYSNTFANDSVLDQQCKKKYPDFFNDENDSVIEGMKSRWNSSLKSTMKTTINADDLQAAVSG